MQKQLRKEQKYVNEQCRWSCPYRWATHAIIVSNTRASAEYKCLNIIKPSNPFTNVCWVSVLTTFSAPPQILAASTVFFFLIRNEEIVGDGFPLIFFLPVCFRQ